jgi:hypothetical protein
MEIKWVSLLSYGMTVKMLQGFLAAGERLNAAAVRNHTLRHEPRLSNVPL